MEMDRTLVNIASILVGGAGLLTVLTGFNVPQLNMSFFGENPFAVKRDIIDTTVTWVFTTVALGGLILQLWAEVWGGHLPDRSHSPKFYINFSVWGLVAVGLMIWALTGFGHWVAKMQWQPQIVLLQREVFDRSKFAVEHDGWSPDHWENREALARTGESLRLQPDGLKDADRQLTQIQELLEVRPQGDLADRVAALQPFFSR